MVKKCGNLGSNPHFSWNLLDDLEPVILLQPNLLLSIVCEDKMVEVRITYFGWSTLEEQWDKICTI